MLSGVNPTARRLMSLPTGGLRRRLLQDTAWYGFAAVVAKALSLLTVPLLARSLGTESYGLADLATSTAALLTLLASLSADIPATRLHALSADGASRRSVISGYLLVVAASSVALGLIALPLSSVVAGGAWGAPDAAGLAALTLLLVPISAVQAALAQTYRIRGRPRAFALVAVIDLLAQLGLAVVLVLAGFGATGVVAGFIGGSVLGLVVAAAGAGDVLGTRPDLGAARAIVRSGLRFVPHVTAFVLAEWVVRAVLANSLGVQTVATFGIAIRLTSVLTLVGAAFSLAWGPVALAQRPGPDTARLFARALTAYGVVSICGALLLAALGPELVTAFAGAGFGEAAVILPGLALAAAIAGTEYVLVVAAGVADQAERSAVASLTGAAVLVAVAWIAVPWVGIAAVGPAVLIGRAVSFAIHLASVRRGVAVSAVWVTAAAAVGAGVVAILQARIADGSGDIVRFGLAIAAGLIVAMVAARELGGVRPSRA